MGSYRRTFVSVVNSLKCKNLNSFIILKLAVGSGGLWAALGRIAGLNVNQPADMLESPRPRIRMNWPHSAMTPHQSKRYTPLPPHTHTLTHSQALRKSLHPRLHQSSPEADELPSSPRLITSLLSLAANQAQRRERKRDSGGEQEGCLWTQWCLSLSVSFLFIFNFPLSSSLHRGRRREA